MIRSISKTCLLTGSHKTMNLKPKNTKIKDHLHLKLKEDIEVTMKMNNKSEDVLYSHYVSQHYVVVVALECTKEEEDVKEDVNVEEKELNQLTLIAQKGIERLIGIYKTFISLHKPLSFN